MTVSNLYNGVITNWS